MARQGKALTSVDPSAGQGGAAGSVDSESAAAAAAEAAVDADAAAIDAKEFELAAEAKRDAAVQALADEGAVFAADIMAKEPTAHDRAVEIFDSLEHNREGVGAFHAEVEKLAREMIRDASMHARLTRLAHACAEFRNTLGTV